MARYGTVLAEGILHVQAPDGRIEVGDVETVVELVGGPAWTISYTQREKERLPAHETADEGLTVDVVDTINAMTFGEDFVRTLAAQPAEPVVPAGGAPGEGGPGADRRGEPESDAVSPRIGLFVGRLLENLEYGLR